MSQFQRENALATMKERTASLGAWISEIVLQTARFDELKAWYAAVLGRDYFFENEPKQGQEIKNKHGDGGKQVHASDVRAAFMHLEPAPPYNVVFAIFELPWLELTPSRDPGINHMQFKHHNLDALVERIEAMRDAGLHPHRSANHGPVTSFYFRDPDENIVEMCVDNFDDKQELAAFLGSPAFRANPSGIDLDRDDFLARYRAGATREELTRF